MWAKFVCRVPLPDWLKTKRCLYRVNNLNDSIYLWDCFAIYQKIKEGSSESNRGFKNERN